VFSFFYNCVQFFAFLLLLPRLVSRRVFENDDALFSYLGFSLPCEVKKIPGKLRFLIYAVSVGETKAAALLFSKLKESYPEASFYIASRTNTGREEAKRSLPGAEEYFLLPFDFSFLARKVMTRLKPDAVIVVEGDLWVNFLSNAEKEKAFVCLVSAKISSKSYERLSHFPYLAKKLLSPFSLICAQNETFAKRFLDLGVKPSVLTVTGNIKLECSRKLLSESDKEALRARLGIEKEDFVVIFGSTHHPEEKLIAEMMASLMEKHPRMKCIIVPRHPGRFGEVKRILLDSEVPFVMFSDISKKIGNERVICVDAMGLLSDLYQIANVAVVCGSFAPGLKGHNIFEPIQVGVAVFFGPYMGDQPDLVEAVLSADAGIQCAFHELHARLSSLSENPSILEDLVENGKKLLARASETSEKTRNVLLEHFVSHSFSSSKR